MTLLHSRSVSATATDAPRLQPVGDAAPAAPRLRAVPPGHRGPRLRPLRRIDEAKARAAGVDLGRLVDELKRVTAQLAPDAETYASVALAPQGAGGRDVDVVRLALQDPAAVAKRRAESEPDLDRAPGGVVIDISRKRVVLEDETTALTYKEFELLQYLVLREGRTIERAELIASLWGAADEDAPNERTIDVHVRRLRAKLGRYEEIVRTVRGVGYRFDRHADVAIRYASTPSPDLF
ncbi:Sensory transduction protein regX3 [Rathayibacter tanaceti]|uniref:Sensory transduction protein regX3 n=1 Tax=Rathayibacter tanaceti TaxID=1671680 RepID=A0A162J0T4_9MICO|nr:Sensory transduction protein regX3 [Rathayibacter tanaceti]